MNINKLDENYMNIYNDINEIKLIKDNKIRTDSFNELLEKIDDNIVKEKEKIVVKFNNEVNYLNNILKEKKYDLIFYSNKIKEKQEFNLREYNRIKYPDNLTNINNKVNEENEERERILKNMNINRNEINNNISLTIKKREKISKLKKDNQFLEVKLTNLKLLRNPKKTKMEEDFKKKKEKLKFNFNAINKKRNKKILL